MMNKHLINACGSLAAAVFLLAALVACGDAGGGGGGSPSIPSLTELNVEELKEYDTGCNDASTLPENKTEAIASFNAAMYLLPTVNDSAFSGTDYTAPSMGAREAEEWDIDFNYSQLSAEERALFEALGIYDITGYMRGKIYYGEYGDPDAYTSMDINFDMRYRFDSTREGASPSPPWVKGSLKAKGSEYIKTYYDYSRFNAKINAAYAYAIAYKPGGSQKGGKFVLNMSMAVEVNQDGSLRDPLYTGVLLVYKDDGTPFGSYELSQAELDKFILSQQ
jgi:hypothetical protein